ncbi:hypothetical protein MSS2_04709 [Mycobacterium marinum]|uniref:hypothetical protein n=1 Tax=Mycobacterium marinum TaxID=1781 RepID=UPI000E3B6555|nr:hypothetical protein [Mycobacterium marinum]RFZ48542.1 hypothetical protein MSS2_04709 [Mycobacterium marinum]
MGVEAPAWTSDPSAFDYQWQLLTYAFKLPDPADFPQLPGEVPVQDDRLLRGFVEVYEKVAKYAVVAHKGGITLKGEHGNWNVEVNETKDEETVGFATLLATALSRLLARSRISLPLPTC